MPAFAALGLILLFAVDVPVIDDWYLQGRLYWHVITEKYSLYDIFFEQYGECRDTVARLIFAAVGLTVGWHVTIFMVLNWLSVLLTFVVLLRWIPRPRARRTLGCSPPPRC